MERKWDEEPQQWSGGPSREPLGSARSRRRLIAGSRTVLAGVVVAVGPIPNALQPFRLRQVPPNCQGQGGLEGVARLPAELALDLGGVDRVAAVVAGAVL